MHKLILRQLRNYMNVETEDKIPENIIEFVNSVNQAYEQFDQDLLIMERSLEKSSAELLGRNSKLSQTLEELKSLQSQLVHAAKMAGLGELVAGISHEINTPAGAILNAIEEVRKYYPSLLSSLTTLVRELNQESFSKFLNLSDLVINFHENLGTSEIRTISKSLEEKLLQVINSDNIRTVSKNLASIGFNINNINPLIELFKFPCWEIIYKSLFSLGMSQLHIHNVQIAIGRIVNLVKALKLYSHSNTEVLTSSNLKDDINNTLMILGSKIAKGVEIVKEFEEIPAINCYADQLNQVWTNIINNAIEAMNFQGRIIIRLKKIDHRILIEIEDNGPGIANSVKDTLFQPYVTTKPKGEGTGLGLSICKDIILKHKGAIDFESEAGKTIFKIYLPSDLERVVLK